VRTRPGVPLKPHSGNGHAQESPTGSRDT
jgi:hypothetical protein